MAMSFWKNGACLSCLLIFVVGCQTVPKNQGGAEQTESREEVESALTSVVGALSGQEVGSEDLESLGQQIRKDDEARSAVEAIADSLSGTGARIKYCPVTGKRYSPRFEICPEHDVPLKEIDEED